MQLDWTEDWRAHARVLSWVFTRCDCHYWNDNYQALSLAHENYFLSAVVGARAGRKLAFKVGSQSVAADAAIEADQSLSIGGSYRTSVAVVEVLVRFAETG